MKLVANTIPLIDVSPLLDRADQAAIRVVGAQLDEACRTIGFLGVTGHGVSSETIAQLYREAYAFFDCPYEAKMQVARPRPEQNRGYIQTETRPWPGSPARRRRPI